MCAIKVKYLQTSMLMICPDIWHMHVCAHVCVTVSTCVWGYVHECRGCTHTQPYTCTWRSEVDDAGYLPQMPSTGPGAH